jgi:hypothetical protein
MIVTLCDLHPLGVDLQDLQPALDVWQADVDLPVEAPGPGQRRVEHVLPVGRGDDDDLVVGIKTVHLDENGVERLLALVVAAGGDARAAPPADGVDLVKEDDAG